ncbi:MAG: ATP-binding cassette domain-containing protein [Alphaproteobacteria bacterium]|nr:ATP-binding cassette domain-containing protein [Alphaproteobacteria bacterium]
MPVLSATDLCRRVEGRVLFEGLALAVEEGEALRIAGPSGCGKTSLLRLLGWLDRPDAGEVLLSGRTARDWGGPAFRARVAFVAQQPARLPGTPADTVAWLRGIHHARVEEDPVALAEGLGLPAARWDQPWTQLSGGEAQRVALALALCRRPEVLVLDEVTSALDPEAAAAVVQALRGRTVVLASHDARVAEALGAREVAL